MKEKNKSCYYCIIRNNCRLREIVKENSYVFRTTLKLESVDIYSNDYDSIAKFCYLYVKDDIQELSLPSIDIIDKSE